MEVKLHGALLGNYDRPANRPTDRPGQRDSLPKMEFDIILTLFNKYFFFFMKTESHQEWISNWLTYSINSIAWWIFDEREQKIALNDSDYPSLEWDLQFGI